MVKKNIILNFLNKFGISKNSISFKKMFKRNKSTSENKLLELLHYKTVTLSKLKKIPISHLSTIILDYDGNTFLHKFILKFDLEFDMEYYFNIIKYLIKINVDWNVYNKRNQLPLYLITNRNTIKYLLDNNIITDTKFKYNYYHKLLLTNFDDPDIVTLLNEKNISNISKFIYKKLIKTYNISFISIKFSNEELFTKYNINNKILKAFGDISYENLTKNYIINNYNNYILGHPFTNTNDIIKRITKYNPDHYKNYPTKSWLYDSIQFIYNISRFDFYILYKYTITPEINIVSNKYRMHYNYLNEKHVLNKIQVLKKFKTILSNMPKLDKNITLYRGIAHIDDKFTSITSFSLDSTVATNFVSTHLISVNIPKGFSIFPIFLLSMYPNEAEIITIPFKIKKNNQITIPLLRYMYINETKPKKCIGPKINIINDNDKIIICKKNSYIFTTISDGKYKYKYINYNHVDCLPITNLIQSKNNYNSELKIKKKIEMENSIREEIKNNITISHINI